MLATAAAARACRIHDSGACCSNHGRETHAMTPYGGSASVEPCRTWSRRAAGAQRASQRESRESRQGAQ
eukprot:6204754-Prymnesium_polylepis.1